MNWFLAMLFLAGGDRAQEQSRVPTGPEIKQRVMRNLKQSEDALEKYSCLVREQLTELRDNGEAKKQESALKEQFFVNGIEVEHLLEKNGKPLNEGEARDEQKRVDKKVRQYSDEREAGKAHARGERQADLFLRALQLTNGRREMRNGRSTLIYDLAGDPAFKPKKLEERFAESLNGSIALDEASSVATEMVFKTFRDVKIGGGLLANLHKGFYLHLEQQRQPDGVWLLRKAEGSGDARAALFLHQRFRFTRELDKCHRFSVQTEQQIGRPPSPPTRP